MLRVLGSAASSLREKLGESLSSIQQFDAPLDRATTGSIYAFRAFSLGDTNRAKGMEREAIPFFERAIELDPNFAMAHARVGTILRNFGENDRAVDYLKKAFDLRDRISEREKLYISSQYYITVTGELYKAIETYRLWKQAYPREMVPPNNLSFLHVNLAQFDNAVAEARDALKIAPDRFFPYAQLASAQLALNQFDQARMTLEEALKRKLDDWPIRITLYSIAYVQGDAVAMQKQIEWAEGKPGQPRMLQAQAGTAASAGKLGEARQAYRRAVEIARRNNSLEVAAAMTAAEGLTEANIGNFSRARERATAALAISRSRDILAVAAVTLALTGAARPAQSLIDEGTTRFPVDTLMTSLWLPAARATLAIQADSADRAIEVLRAASPHELGKTETLPLVPLYVRGQAYLRARSAQEAAAEFQKIVDHRGIAPVNELNALAKLGLARAAKLTGDAARTRFAYDSFFAQWKDADPDVPILKAARREYATLR